MRWGLICLSLFAGFVCCQAVCAEFDEPPGPPSSSPAVAAAAEPVASTEAEPIPAPALPPLAAKLASRFGTELGRLGSQWAARSTASKQIAAAPTAKTRSKSNRPASIVADTRMAKPVALTMKFPDARSDPNLRESNAALEPEAAAPPASRAKEPAASAGLLPPFETVSVFPLRQAADLEEELQERTTARIAHALSSIPGVMVTTKVNVSSSDPAATQAATGVCVSVPQNYFERLRSRYLERHAATETGAYEALRLAEDTERRRIRQVVEVLLPAGAGLVLVEHPTLDLPTTAAAGPPPVIQEMASSTVMGQTGLMAIGLAVFIATFIALRGGSNPEGGYLPSWMTLPTLRRGANFSLPTETTTDATTSEEPADDTKQHDDRNAA
ncbi:hypothetical protein [Lignipirellula cremea]|uniref:Flagellar MS-ring protein n=1 Tax=Lignipirellula cremea TaxID=2528010 RepID=A0A518DPX1_9BACT|nr:hypothetical protein [Lignipirellula cremea]QDU93887.1 hypothetical protein Pla8534_16720 [Lignipirellula cremea]